MWLRLWIWFKAVRRDLVLLFIACRHPATPRYLKVMFWCALLYFISPVDFLPDYLPGLGAVDDLTIVPAVFYYISRMLPPEIKWESENEAAKAARRMPYLLLGAAVFAAAWIAMLVWGIYSLLK